MIFTKNTCCQTNVVHLFANIFAHSSNSFIQHSCFINFPYIYKTVRDKVFIITKKVFGLDSSLEWMQLYIFPIKGNYFYSMK